MPLNYPIGDPAYQEAPEHKLIAERQPIPLLILGSFRHGAATGL